MKKAVIKKLLTTTTLILMGFSVHQTPAYVCMANSIIETVGDSISRKYDLIVSGHGGSMMHCVQKLDLVFNSYKILTKNQIRRIVIECAEDLIEKTNSNDNLRPFLCNYPFNANNLIVTVLVLDEEEDAVWFPNIHAATLVDGQISFETFTKDKPFLPHTEEKESYEDALKLVRTGN